MGSASSNEGVSFVDSTMQHYPDDAPGTVRYIYTFDVGNNSVAVPGHSVFHDGQPAVEPPFVQDIQLTDLDETIRHLRKQREAKSNSGAMYATVGGIASMMSIVIIVPETTVSADAKSGNSPEVSTMAIGISFGLIAMSALMMTARRLSSAKKMLKEQSNTEQVRRYIAASQR